MLRFYNKNPGFFIISCTENQHLNNPMDYSVFIDQTLTQLGLRWHAEFSAYDQPWHPDQGWPIKMPNIEPGKFLVLHLPDFVTVRDGRVLEFERLEQRYGAHSDRVIVHVWNHGLAQTYSGPLRVVEFSNHNHDTAQNLHQIYPQWQTILNNPRHGWQCLNGRVCRHRRRAVNILRHWPGGTLSLGHVIPLPQHSYAQYYQCNNQQNFMNLLTVYGSAAVNIVTETLYDHSPGIVTEKTQMAIAAEQIPIVIGYRGIVQHCRDLGFDMFDDVVDTSYDQLPNNVRVEQALWSNQDLIQGRIDLAPYRARLQKNREFLLTEFAAQCRRRYREQIMTLSADLIKI